MGVDPAVVVGGEVGVKEPGDRSQEATVIELLPSAAYRVKLQDETVVMAHAAGAGVRNFERLRPGDRVRVELSPHDRTRGRIVELLKG